MMRGARSTLVMLVLFLALGGYAYFVESERPPASEADANEQAFGFEADDVTELRVVADNGDVTSLARTAGDDGSWSINSPVDVDADDNAASSIVSGLASLEIQRVVEAEPSDLTAFGLSDPAIDVGFRTTDDTVLRHLLIGDATPTGADRYAKTDGGARVFLVASHLESTFNRATFDLRDKTALDFEGPDVNQLVLAADDGTIRLVKGDGRWRMTEPWDARADFGVVEGLVGRIGSAEMQSIERETTDERDAETDPFELDEARVTVTLDLGSASASLLVGGEAPEGTVYARDASRSGLVFTIDASLVADLARAAGAYRDKDLFAFRPFNSSRLEVDRGGNTTAFEKADTADEGGTAWQRVPPGADVDQSAMDDLLAQLSALRAGSFVDVRADTGVDAPLATFRVEFDDGEDVEEVVIIGRTGDDTYGVHGDEPGAAVLDTRAVDEALEALDAVIPES